MSDFESVKNGLVTAGPLPNRPALRRLTALPGIFGDDGKRSYDRNSRNDNTVREFSVIMTQ